MKDSIMAKSGWRTAQIFLSARGIFEVDVSMESDDIRCTCPGFVSRSRCKHSIHVLKVAEKNGGTYPIKVSSRATSSESEHAHDSYESFREFVIKFGKIEVI
jgi:hypothetical protein